MSAIRITRVKGGYWLVVCSDDEPRRRYKAISLEEMPESLRPAKHNGKYLPYATEADAERAARALMELWHWQASEEE